MSGRKGTRKAEGRLALVAPSARRARAAARRLGGRWKGERIAPAALGDFLLGPPASRFLLCPEGRRAAADVVFLAEAARRLCWPSPDADLGAAVAGLRGEHLAVHGTPTPEKTARGRKTALLMEGIVTPGRAARAARSPARDWIVESPFHVRLSRRRLRELGARGVRWFSLHPVRLEAVLVLSASDPLVPAWRRVLPPRTRIVALAETKD